MCAYNDILLIQNQSIMYAEADVCMGEGGGQPDADKGEGS